MCRDNSILFRNILWISAAVSIIQCQGGTGSFRRVLTYKLTWGLGVQGSPVGRLSKENTLNEITP